jgi:hypothetical protein
MCLPPNGSSLAEWRRNLAGAIEGLGTINVSDPVRFRDWSYPGGFATIGTLDVRSSRFVAEGQQPESLALQHIAFAALPDNRTVAVMQYAVAANRAYISQLRGLYLHVPNDVYNGYSRTYETAAGTIEADGRSDEPRYAAFDSGWLNVDGRLGVVRAYGPRLGLYGPGRRNIALKQYEWNDQSLDIGLLRTDQIVQEFVDTAQIFDRGATLLDNGFSVLAGTDAVETAAAAAERAVFQVDTASSCVRWMAVIGADGRHYAIIANFDSEPAACRIESEAGMEPLIEGDNASFATEPRAGGSLQLQLAPYRLAIYRTKLSN